MNVDELLAWSPDGRRIAFVSKLDGGYGVFVMDGDGNDVIKLSRGQMIVSGPSWSPDGQRIAFVCHPEDKGDRQICVMGADGSDLKWLTYDTGWKGETAWSPDGQRIAFTYASPRGGNPGDPDICVIDTDGNNMVNLGAGREPAWSPDGQRIALASISRARNWDIYVMGADGSNRVNLTNSSAQDSSPTWSPDGLRIAFVSRGDGGGIFVMDADGSNVARLLDRAGVVSVAWAPRRP